MAESINCVEQVELMEEDILRATTYLPILDKAAMAQVLAQTCIQKMNLVFQWKRRRRIQGKKMMPSASHFPRCTGRTHWFGL